MANNRTRTRTEDKGPEKAVEVQIGYDAEYSPHQRARR